MALTLPLELQQHVFSYLDPRSFYSARNVCQWWRHASRDAVTLTHQLGQLPIEPALSAKKTNSRRRQSMYDEAARTLMLGMTVQAQRSGKEGVSARLDKAKVAVSSDGRRAVSLHDRMLSWYDTTREDMPIISQRPINDLRTAIGGGPWFKCAPTSVYELALSSDGRMLAVALERTIHIYDLDDERDSWPVSSYIPSATGHYIAGLQFEHNDSLLRVQLSNKGVVVYLGSPKDSNPGLEHWQDKGGLKHAFLDSSRLQLPPTAPPSQIPQRVAGLQLLQPLADGWLFAAQKHDVSQQSSCYCLAYVKFSQIHGHVSTAERTVNILEELPVQVSEHVRDNWNELPSAHIHHPHFALSQDNSLLAMAEDTSLSPTSAPSNRVFLYRLSTAESMAMHLDLQKTSVENASEKELEHKIQRLPMSLGTVHGKMLDLAFQPSQTSDGSFKLAAVSNDDTMIWSLLDS